MDSHTVGLATLGCKLNQADTEHLARQIHAAGYIVTGLEAGCDAYIINTCTVTHVADRKSRHLVRHARSLCPQALVIATGCYAQRAPQEIARLPGIDLVIGNDEKERLTETLRAKLGGSGNRQPTKANWQSRTRALVKIQDGCNEFCSYCVVPQTRCRERSIPLSQIIAEIKERVEEGYKEITLTGTHIGAYGRDCGTTSILNLATLIEQILYHTKVERLRITSLHPQDLSPSLLQLWTDQRLCRHIHLPLQSGSDRILSRMGRGYTTKDYAQGVALAREMIPNVAITSDVIVGFPGEEEMDFGQTYEFCQQMAFANLHIFPYSARPGTAASSWCHQVEARAKKERTRKLLQLAQESARYFAHKSLGRSAMVLWEKKCKEEGDALLWSGLTDNYLRVYTTCSHESLANQVLPTQLIAIRDNGLVGKVENR
ncbi:MAG: tRNA (N(6)-L-threonylcarbamoyladenosine(37)-C(2))-methylthiotransferase MtaB [Chloroflexi bacterium]|nr:tRNA (N(6)-L-threonylcarbamoyladenosine(37)-C(2))-methylthiotransferase MtaB [Chloroflexota bacterium]